MPEPARTKPRRTQAERRATTRTALLDAAIVSLVSDGYSNMTTRRVAERAGVSQGTQQHYFASKQDFVVEAMRYAGQQIAADVLQRINVHDLRDPTKYEDLLDELWRVHQSDAFKAAMELWIAARTDEALRRNMQELEQEVTRTIAAAAGAALHGDERQPVALQVLELGLAAIRGLAMLAPVVPEDELAQRWETVRTHLASTLGAQVAAPA